MGVERDQLVPRREVSTGEAAPVFTGRPCGRVALGVLSVLTRLACGHGRASLTEPRARPLPPPAHHAQEAERGKKELARFLPVLENALAGAEWLVGEYSLADVAFAPHLGFLVQYGFDFPGTPRVRAWLERTRARPAWQKAHALIFDGYAA